MVSVDGRNLKLTRRGALSLAGGCGAAMLLGACGQVWPSEALRYRMTVEVDTPNGVKVGSSVVESIIKDGLATGQASGIRYEFVGEAVAIELGSDQLLFALLTSPRVPDPAAYHASLFHESLELGALATPPMPRRFGADEWAQERRVARKIMPSVDLAAESYPVFVRFEDVSDPRSVAVVDANDLTATFGSGVRLQRISLQICENELTERIERILPWLRQYPDANLDIFHGALENASLAQQLTYSQFRMKFQ